MDKIINQIQDASFLGIVKTKKVVSILEENKKKRNWWNRWYYAVYSSNQEKPLFIWAKSKVDVIMKVHDELFCNVLWEMKEIARSKYDNLKRKGIFFV